MDETFSIVIPVYNRRDVVEPTLRSLVNQTYRPLHIILVDNNSTDGTLALLQKWAQVNTTTDFRITVTHETTPGAAAARNKGLSLVESRYMLFFDSDDLLWSDAVQSYMKAFRAPAKPEIVMARTMLTDSLSGHTHLMPLRRGDAMIAHIHHATLRTQGYAVSTSLMRRVGAWDETTLIWDDWELGIRLLLATKRIVQIPDITCTVVTSPRSITGACYSQSAHLYEAPLQAAEKALKVSGRSDTEKLTSLMDYRRIMLAAHYAREGATEAAHKLKAEVLRRADAQYPLRRRLLLRIAYQYIRRGGRGFDRLITLLY